MKRAIVIIPTYNERENIQKAVSLLFEVFEKITTWKMEVLVVDDSSPDKTADVVTTLQKKYPALHLLINQKKAGLGGAYLKGMAKAFGELKADVVFEFDADLSHDATKIPLFLEKLDKGYDMVLGSRYIPGGSIPNNWGLHRKLLSVVGNWVIIFVLTNFSIRDWTGGFRAITRKVYDAVEPEMHDENFSGYTFQIGFLYKAVCKGFKITEVAFHFVDREIGQSKMGPDYLKNILLYLFRARAQQILSHRIFKFLVVGGIGTLIQLTALAILRQIFPHAFQLAFFLAIEVAVLSNFLLNNLWTFSDRKLKLSQLPAKFLQFNIASAGSIMIQQVIAFLGEAAIGLHPLGNLPLDTGTIFALTGIIIGMFWNFFAYNAFIWKKKN